MNCTNFKQSSQSNNSPPLFHLHLLMRCEVQEKEGENEWTGHLSVCTYETFDNHTTPPTTYLSLTYPFLRPFGPQAPFSIVGLQSSKPELRGESPYIIGLFSSMERAIIAQSHHSLLYNQPTNQPHSCIHIISGNIHMMVQVYKT